jgi:hypothetical protein
VAFRVPAMPLSISIWRNQGTLGLYTLPNLITVCNLSPGRRVMANVGLMPMEFLFPKLTDVRAAWNSGTQDLLECPSGSKRFYDVEFVDDVGKGFANEYRIVFAQYYPNGNTTLVDGPFPAPIPLP